MALKGEILDQNSIMGIPMKTISLITLTFQNSALILLMHYSRIMPSPGTHRYLTSTAVFLNELIKLALSLTIALYDISRTLPPSTPATALFEQLYHSVFSGDGWKLALPAVLYFLQNTLQYVAVSNLDAVHFQILYQLKILTTALFSVTILNRSLTSKKWFALVLLTLGVALVQLPTETQTTIYTLKDAHKSFYLPRSFHEAGQAANSMVEVAGELTKRSIQSMSEGASNLAKRSATYEGIEEDLGLVKPALSYPVGVSAVLAAATISGITGVYFEKVLKDSSTSVSVWTRNVQLSFYSLFPSLILGCLVKDGEDIQKFGFFVGYNSVVWTTVVSQAVGGVLVAVCINYADNIAKNFATSISILISFLFSVWVFEFKFTTNFLFGTAVVIFATYLYSAPEARRNRPPPINIASYEKTVADDGYTPRLEEDKRLKLDVIDEVKSAGLSSSRPSSPAPTGRHHSRAGSSRGRTEKTE